MGRSWGYLTVGFDVSIQVTRFIDVFGGGDGADGVGDGGGGCGGCWWW